MGYYQLTARQDYWKLVTCPDACLLSHWMNDKFSQDKFAYIWRNIHLGLPDEEEAIDDDVLDIDSGRFDLE